MPPPSHSGRVGGERVGRVATVKARTPSALPRRPHEARESRSCWNWLPDRPLPASPTSLQRRSSCQCGASPWLLSRAGPGHRPNLSRWLLLGGCLLPGAQVRARAPRHLRERELLVVVVDKVNFTVINLNTVWGIISQWHLSNLKITVHL